MNRDTETVPARHATPDLAKPGALWTQAIYDRIVYDLAVGGER